MSIIRILAILLFDLIEIFFHQKKILINLKLLKIKINTFIDVGAHKGTYTDLIIKNFNPKKIIMFEPQNKILKIIKEKYKKKKFIKIYNYAVSEKNKYTKFFINRHDLTSSLSKLDINNSYLQKKSKLFVKNKSENLIKNICIVKTIKLIDIIKKNNLKEIDLLKIDTEGHEYEVLKGLESKIKIVKIILIEFHNDNIYLKYNKNKIKKFLKTNNFVFIKKFKFPFTEWEDRIYLNKELINLYH